MARRSRRSPATRSRPGRRTAAATSCTDERPPLDVVAEPWSAHESDRPYLKPAEDRPNFRPARRFNPWIAVAAIAAVAWIGAFSFRWVFQPAIEPAPQATPLAQEPSSDRPVPTTPAGRF